MGTISVLIKPCSSSCNLNCKYCFYRQIASNRMVESYGVMDSHTLELAIKKIYEISQNGVSFIFQGGEPTLAGLDFYKKLLILQRKHNTKELVIENSIQTNGVLIDEEWAQFMLKNNFL